MKTKTKFLSLLFALFMSLVSMGTLGTAVIAHADGENSISPFEPNPDPDLTSLYYFTDNRLSEEYFYGGIVEQYVKQNPYIKKDENGKPDAHFFYWDPFYAPDSFKYSVENLWDANYFHDIENAFIIFEVRYSLSKQLGVYRVDEPESEKAQHYENSVYQLMEEMFSFWKEKCCKIMFIAETDEAWFETYMDEFLDCVDIHVNLDLITPFTYSVVCDIDENHSLYSSAMLFDSYTSEDWYFRDFFMKYVEYTFYEKHGEIFQNVDAESNLNDFGSSAYFFYGGGTDREWMNEAVENSNFAYAITGIDSLNNDVLLDIFNNHPEKTFLYVYNEKYIDVGEIPEGVKYCGITADELEFYISEIMRDFILNDLDSLNQYNNWEGRCNVSFKPLFGGEGGWMKKPSKAYRDVTQG